MHKKSRKGKRLLLSLALWGVLFWMPGPVLALEPIQNIKVSLDGILSWSAFPGTANYWVGINGSSVPTDKLQADLKELLATLVLDEGNYLVELSAADNNGNTLSDTWTRTYHIAGGPGGSVEEVVAEAEISTEGIMTWKPYAGADAYLLGIDGHFLVIEDFRCDLNEKIDSMTDIGETMAEKDHVITLEIRSNTMGLLTVWERTYSYIAKKAEEAVDLSAASVTVGDATFNGKEKKPRPRVVLDGKALKSGTDYKAVYSKNRKVGMARLVITGTGAYKGRITARFQIRPKPTSLVKVTGGTKRLSLTWKKQSPQVSGYQIEISRKKNFSKAEKALEIKGASKVKKLISGLSRGKTYYVRIRTFKAAGGNRYYSAWSKIRYVKTR